VGTRFPHTLQLLGVVAIQQIGERELDLLDGFCLELAGGDEKATEVGGRRDFEEPALDEALTILKPIEA